MAEPVRVLWLIKGLGPGGAERLLVDMARHVDRERFSYECCYLLPWKDHLVGELGEAGVGAVCLGSGKGYDPRWIGRLRDRVRDGGIALTHAHLPSAGIGARMGLRGRGALVYTEHNTWERYKPMTRRLNAATYRMQDAVIAVSEDVARSIGARIEPPVTVIPNGVDVDRLRAGALSREEARAELGLSPEDVVVGTVGGLTPKKGHAVLVGAAREVIARVPRARFVFIGLEVDPAPIRTAIAESGVGDHVALAGYHAEASRLMRAFDVYCLPSLFEGMPVSLLEAMALGLPSVVTRVGGVPEIATDRLDALLVEPSDPAALASALIALMDSPELRAELGSRAMQTAAGFSLETMVRRTEEVYLRALESGR